jgi:hypothetical protein
MSWEFQIARIAWTTSGETVTALDLTGDVIDYAPAQPELAVTRTAGPRDGAYPVSHESQNVTESVRIRVNVANAKTTYHNAAEAIRRALLWAEDLRRDRRVVVRFRDTERFEAGIYYEATLYNARLELQRGGMLRISWERSPYWSGPEELLTVKNNWTEYSEEVTPDGDGYADYAQITNCDDDNPLHNNWLIVEAPGGTVETPLHVRINNNYDDDRLKAVRLGWSDRPQAFTLEGEDADGGVYIAPGAEYSNQAHARSDRFVWEVEHSDVRDYVGRFRVLANGNLSGTWQMWAGYALTKKQEARYPDGASYATGADGWTEIGELSLPPGPYLHPPRPTLKLWLEGSGEAWLDYVAFVPVQRWQHRYLWFSDGYNCVPGACIFDDGWRGEFGYDYGGVNYASLSAYGEPIRLRPQSSEQMLTFALTSDSDSAEALRSALVAVYARPRYDVLP